MIENGEEGDESGRAKRKMRTEWEEGRGRGERTCPSCDQTCYPNNALYIETLSRSITILLKTSSVLSSEPIISALNTKQNLPQLIPSPSFHPVIHFFYLIIISSRVTINYKRHLLLLITLFAFWNTQRFATLEFGTWACASWAEAHRSNSNGVQLTHLTWRTSFYTPKTRE